MLFKDRCRPCAAETVEEPNVLSEYKKAVDCMNVKERFEYVDRLPDSEEYYPTPSEVIFEVDKLPKRINSKAQAQLLLLQDKRSPFVMQPQAREADGDEPAKNDRYMGDDA